MNYSSGSNCHLFDLSHVSYYSNLYVAISTPKQLKHGCDKVITTGVPNTI